MNAIPFSGIRQIVQQATELEKAGARILHLEIGRPDFDTPQHIKDAATRALDEGQVHYTSNYGIIELREAIAEKLSRENHITVDPATEIIVTVGTNEAVALAMLALINPGDEVLIPDPAWLHYFYCVQLAGGVPVHVPLRAENRFQLDPADLRRALTPRTKMMIVNSPHNPTGAVFTPRLLNELAQVAIAHDLWVLSDEIYEKIIYGDAQHISLASLPGMAQRTITVNGFSKTYSMTGWRLGYVAAPRELTDAMIRVHQYTATSATSFAQFGALAAYRGSQECVRAMVDEFERRRRFLLDALAHIAGFDCVEPQGAFYVFPSIKRLGIDSNALALRLLRQAGVAVVPGSAFGEYGEGYLRLAYSNTYENIVEAVERMARAVRELPPSRES
ncbi:MAG: pyridoxal phosphate-dependent aminotransferase [Chloroflexi bacterium]|nr:pyridoxal phosphate-dependent aminotransferase [Chloroflexota bacterium]